MVKRLGLVLVVALAAIAPSAASAPPASVTCDSIIYPVGDVVWKPKRVVIVEFDSLEKARAFSDAAEYAPAKAARHRSSVSSVLVVEGVPPS